MLFIILALFFCVSVNSEGVNVSNRTCSSYNATSPDFELSQLEGRWFAVASYDKNAACILYTISNITTSQANLSIYSNLTSTGTNGTLTKVPRNSTYELDMFVNNTNYYWKLLNIETDLLLLWSCEDSFDSSRQSLLLLHKSENWVGAEKLLNSSPIKDQTIPINYFDNNFCTNSSDNPSYGGYPTNPQVTNNSTTHQTNASTSGAKSSFGIIATLLIFYFAKTNLL